MRMSINEMYQEIEDMEKEMANTDDEEREYQLKCEVQELRDAIAICSED